MPKLTLIPDTAPPTGTALTALQSRFVMAYTSAPGAIGNASEAARIAGYSEKSAAEIGRQLLENQKVRDAIDRANRSAISGRLAAKSIEVLERALDDPDTPPRVRVMAACAVLDRGGYAPPTAFEKAAAAVARETGTRPISQMTLLEIERRLEILQGRGGNAVSGDNARLIEGEAITAPDADGEDGDAPS